MKLSTSVASLAATAGLAQADQLTPEQNAVLIVLFKDVFKNFPKYGSWFMSSGFGVPNNIIEVYEAAHTYTDDSFSTMLTSLEMSQIMPMVTAVPWYSSYLSAEVAAALAPFQTTVTHTSSSSPAAPTTTSTTSSTTTDAPTTSSTPTTTAAPSTTADGWTTLPVEDPMVQSMELAVYVKDINANMQQYLNFQQANPGQPYPPAIAQAVMHAMMGQPESEYMTLLTGIDPATVQMMLSGVPWYSTRLEQALDATFRARHVVVKTAAPGESSAAASSVVSSTAASSAAASSAAASSVVSSAPVSSVAASSAPVSSVVASSAAASSVVSSAPRVFRCCFSVSAAPTERNTTYGVSTQWTTATSLYHNTTTVNSCPSESAKTATTTTGKTDTLTSTVCDEVCHSKKSEEAKRTATATEVNTSTVTATVCDEVCHSKKSEEAKKSAAATTTICDEVCESKKSAEATQTATATVTTTTGKGKAATSGSAAGSAVPTTVAQVTKSTAVASPAIHQQTANGAVKNAAGFGFGVLAAAALLL
ncbi:uncharacterized protein KNAG_0B06950 [Huiozyma naganishii CBS 8797]|uniref:Uncharacterized protein n=1 Tax=Huiozyma naganishii (strain ATCC MYA-139 / BCRC 22969 / CBS 8797 / KCTC 17520 / NBRC 10181 / NCYC 3082 / Yp74L-3) TaxID=1071383 RepID=J7S467_HUIN7|nr:hypothetical protein KNAG_0B06950 [Kazachstania naganishii CBS 8797]CCK69119.1 hypothetical protein KNAG_0B06950 [Kazachstania naganishii CBS 8797]